MNKALVLLLILALGACGKMGQPEPAGPSQDVTWPKSYPSK